MVQLFHLHLNVCRLFVKLCESLSAFLTVLPHYQYTLAEVFLKYFCSLLYNRNQSDKIVTVLSKQQDCIVTKT